MITKKEILGQLEKDGVNLGSKPERVLNFYIEKRFIEPSIRRKNRLGLYPNNTVELIKKIKDFQAKGKTLAEIKKIFIKMREKDKYEKQKKFLNATDHHLRWQEMIIKLLNLEEDPSYDLYYMGRVDKGENKKLSLAIIALKEEDGVSWFCIDVSTPDEEKILGEEKMSLREFNIFIQTVATKNMEKGKILKRKDVFETIYSMYFS